MPVYNCEKYIHKAIKSILNQTWKSFKLIIIDDNSTDNTSWLLNNLSNPQVLIIRNKVRLGVAKCLNIGLEKAKGKYICRMDADDVADPKRLAIQIEYLENHTDVGVLGTGVFLIDETGKIIGRRIWPNKWSIIKRCLPVFNPLIHSSVMFRKKLIDDYGAYDENLNGAEDYDLWLRLAKHTQIINLPKPLVQYRYSQSGISFSNLKQTQRAAILAQIKSVFQYHYPVWNLVFVLKNMIGYLLPYSVVKLLYTTFYAIKK